MTKCDLTQKPQYFDEKLERGGHSHKMMETIDYAVEG
jgi:hypothetical protein